MPRISTMVRISDSFEQVATTSPQAVALRSSFGIVTYGDLFRATEALTQRFLSLASADNPVVAIHARRTAGLPAALLACSRAGLTFAVLDSAYPAPKLTSMMAVLKPSLIVAIDQDCQSLRAIYPDESATPVVALDSASLGVTEVSGTAPANPATGFSGADIAYLLFTSGTTGVPKCIQTRHDPLVHFVNWYRDQFGPQPNSRFSLLSGLGHDPVLRDLFVPLSVGAPLCIPDQGLLSQPAALFRWFADQRIQYLHTTPQLLKVIAAGVSAGQGLPDLSFVFSGGDALKMTHVADVRRLAPGAQVVNFYGATETPQAMGFHVVEEEESDPIPAGRGISDVTLLVLDPQGAECSPGTAGQIGIRTRYLSDGYRNDPEATAAKFLTAPSGEVLYLTGDLGSLRPDGAVVIQGRGDDQVKVRGFRVELGEVTRALEAIPGVGDAMVLALKDDGENALHGFLVSRTPGGDDSTRVVRQRLAAQLPAYMVPSTLLWIDKMPLLPNGKVDRNQLAALAEAEASRARDEASFTPGDSLDRELRMILRVPELDLAASFVDHGGDSLSVIRASMVVEKSLGWLPVGWERMPLRTVLSQKKQKKRFRLSTVGSPIIARAVGIFNVVLAHFGLFVISGSNTLLFLVAGWSIGNYQLRTVLQEERIGPFLKTLLALMIPTTLFNLLSMVPTGAIDWPILLMVNTYFTTGNNGGYWFINVLCHVYMLLALVFAFPAVRRWVRQDTFLIAFIATLVMTAFAAGSYYLQGGNPIKTPFQQLWLILLGISVSRADTWQRKVLVGLVTLLCGYDDNGDVFLHYGRLATVACFFVILIPRVKMPRLFATVINLTAGASMFLYLSHRAFRDLVLLTPWTGNPWLYVAVAMVGGILLWQVWDRVYNPLSSWVVAQVTGRTSGKVNPGVVE
jgi:amino acid adenylation domain-containing protein